MNKNQIFYVGLYKFNGMYKIYVSNESRNCYGDSYYQYLNEIPLRKNHWRAAVKHYEKYNMYDYFYKAAIEDLFDRRNIVGGSLVEAGLGNVEDWISKNKDEIKQLAKSLMDFSVMKDEKGDCVVVRY